MRQFLNLFEAAKKVLDYGDPSCTGPECRDVYDGHDSECDITVFSELRFAVIEAKEYFKTVPHRHRRPEYAGASASCLFCGAALEEAWNPD